MSYSTGLIGIIRYCQRFQPFLSPSQSLQGPTTVFTSLVFLAVLWPIWARGSLLSESVLGNAPWQLAAFSFRLLVILPLGLGLFCTFDYKLCYMLNCGRRGRAWGPCAGELHYQRRRGKETDRGVRQENRHFSCKTFLI